MPPYLEVLDIYSSDNNGCKARTKEAVLLNNSMYWVVHHKSDHCYKVNNNNNDHYILKFDMVDEVFERIAESRSEIEKRYLKQTHIGATQENKLYVCQLYDEASNNRHQYVVEMWVLDDDKRDSWNIKYRIEQGKLWNYDMLKVTGDGKVIIFENRCRGKGIMGNLLIFDGPIGKGKYIHIDCRYSKPYGINGNRAVSDNRVVNYIPSLISPNSI
ncbi:uncharacterized protein LOC110726590 [Chenopodium quinoa]|uniref:uncharacterized protein LOC110726590 n=1 Tax=Chenopodium quinoa TaxID=63459 RepID=UPI000B794994|nr:uncharacterized protein LOC110726590 [Chenopodium quinoa]